MFYTIYNHIRLAHYDELAGMPPHKRQATLFRYYTEQIPIAIPEGDILAGRYGYEDDLTPVAPPKPMPGIRVFTEEEKRLNEHFKKYLSVEIGFHRSHTCIDYGEVIGKGLRYYLEQVEQKLSEQPEHDFYLAMRDSIETAIAFGGRYAALAEQMASDAKNDGERSRLTRMSEALRRVPEYGARNFYEAVQSLWLLHNLIPMAEMGWYSISVGRMDQYLYPYYLRASEDGISREDMKSILKNLFQLLDSYGDGACALNVGGVDAEGREMYNELSWLLLEVEKETALRAPIFAARISPNTPEDFFDALIDFELFRIGQPTFYGEMPCRRAVAGRGIPEAEAATFSANSCMGLILGGREFANMWGIKFNMNLPLEVALCGGVALHNELGFTTVTKPREINSEDELLEAYGAYLEEIMGMSADISYAVAKNAATNTSDPFLSVLTEGCIESGLDRAIGATYDTVTVEGMGMINACDAIEAICELVFDRKKYTIGQMLEAAKRNYEGDAELLYDIRNCKKYGMNDERCNRIVARVGQMLSKICREKSHGNYLFLPSLHTIDENVKYGSTLPATLDGRLAGEPVSKNANPSLLLKDIEPTSVIISAACVPQTDFSGGQPIDLFFDKAQFATKESRDKIKAMIRTYFELGGLQFQVNSVDIELLERAYANPEAYPNLIIRKGGYSVRFGELSRDAQREFIEQSRRGNPA